jgi:hypothetical protein
MAAWLATSPASSCRRHSRALWSVSTTCGVRGSRGGLGGSGGLGAYRGGGTAQTTRSAGTRCVRTPILPFSNAPSGPNATSTVCSRSSTEPLTWSADTWIMRNQTSGTTLRDLPREIRGGLSRYRARYRLFLRANRPGQDARISRVCKGFCESPPAPPSPDSRRPLTASRHSRRSRPKTLGLSPLGTGRGLQPRLERGVPEAPRAPCRPSQVAVAPGAVFAAVVGLAKRAHQDAV